MIKNILSAVAAVAALFALGACSSSGDGGWQTPEPLVADVAPGSPQRPAVPPVDFDSAADRAYLGALHDRGIRLDDDTAMQAADMACASTNLFASVRKIAAATGLTQSDAAYLYGAATVTCGGDY